MKIEVLKKLEVEAKYVVICIPLRYDDDGGMEKDFPLRNGGKWEASINLNTGKILDWPADKMGKFEVYEKVCDEGIYKLIDPEGIELAQLKHEYVPHGIVPGEYGDYVVLEIEDGRVTNLPAKLDAEEFFGVAE